MSVSLAQLIVVAMFFTLFSQAHSKPPHIIQILADDYGWADVGYHRKEDPTTEVRTPVIDQLVTEGVELDRLYVYYYCSPTRSGILSGRNPIHVNALNSDIRQHNPADPVSGFQGIPRNMTVIAEKLKEAGYATHMFGKWHAGLATPDHTPKGRGFDTSLHYFDAANDYWTMHGGPACAGVPTVDLWNTDHPASFLNNSAECSQSNQPQACVYEDALFTNHLLSVINAHDPTVPLYVYWAPHNIHAPLEVPQEFLAKFSGVDVTYRRSYMAMVSYLDTNIGKVVDALKAKGMYEDTLITFNADNGGPVYNNGTAGANNYPLRGGKMSNFEGGVRVNAFISGGFVPEERRGAIEKGYLTGWDWFSTFCGLAGVDPEDQKAKKAGLPPIDSLDMWPLLSGKNSTSPRTEIPLGSFREAADGTVTTLVTGLIQGPWKLLIGPNTQNGWQGPIFPNISTNWNSGANPLRCGLAGCLFNIIDDPTEHFDVAAQRPVIRSQLVERIAELQKGVFSPDRGSADPLACHAATTKYGGFWGPWLD